MIIAGIDEAGYGPLLGPLCVGSCALSVDAAPPGGDLWKILKRAVSASRDPTGKRIHVNDSKKVFSPSVGIRELERSILSLLAAQGTPAESWADAVVRLCPDSRSELSELPWYADAGLPFPADNTAMSIRMSANQLRHEMTRAGVAVADLRTFVVHEQRLNLMFDQTRNKGATSFFFVATHMARLMSSFAHENLTIFCDRQGGREHYAPVLRQMFDDWSLTVESESSDRAEYSLHRDKLAFTIIFQEKAEQACMSVAIASMLAKYFREVMMHRFNAHWTARAPGLKPTAGYWTDGQRFIEDLRSTGVASEEQVQTLVRRR
jgi:ribonuclease HII